MNHLVSLKACDSLRYLGTNFVGAMLSFERNSLMSLSMQLLANFGGLG